MKNLILLAIIGLTGYSIGNARANHLVDRYRNAALQAQGAAIEAQKIAKESNKLTEKLIRDINHGDCRGLSLKDPDNVSTIDKIDGPVMWLKTDSKTSACASPPCKPDVWITKNTIFEPPDWPAPKEEPKPTFWQRLFRRPPVVVK